MGDQCCPGKAFERACRLAKSTALQCSKLYSKTSNLVSGSTQRINTSCTKMEERVVYDHLPNSGIGKFGSNGTTWRRLERLSEADYRKPRALQCSSVQQRQLQVGLLVTAQAIQVAPRRKASHDHLANPGIG
jgi:hypothetical protein